MAVSLNDIGKGAAAFGAFADPLVNLTSGILNFISGKKTNESNEKINERNLEYNQAMTQQQWERDDNAHQREVADLKAAGLSPLAATNGSQTTAAISAPNPIAMQAPQLDLNNMFQSLLENKALNETERHNRMEEGFKSIDMLQQAEKIKQTAEQLKIENRKVNEQINYNAKYLVKLGEQIAETNRSNLKQEELKKLETESKYFYESIKAQTGGNFNYKIYKDSAEYEAALSVWSTEFENFINTYISDTSASSTSSYSSGYSGGVSVGNKAFGTSGNLSDNESQSGSHSYNVSQKQAAELERFYRTHPMPVFYGG